MNNHIQQAADVMGSHLAIHRRGNPAMGGPNLKDKERALFIAADLADAGLLVTPEQRNVLDAAVNGSTWELAAAVDALRAATTNGGE